MELKLFHLLWQRGWLVLMLAAGVFVLKGLDVIMTGPTPVAIAQAPACLDQLFEPGSGQPGGSLSGRTWLVDKFELTAKDNVDHIVGANPGVRISNVGDLTISGAPCTITSVTMLLQLSDLGTNASVRLSSSSGELDVLPPMKQGSYSLRVAAVSLRLPVTLTVQNAFLTVQSIEVNSQLNNARAALRILLVTQGNHVAEYHVEIVPGIARGHPNQFNQWLVAALNQNKDVLYMYGIWDPRVVLRHDISGGHSRIDPDPQTAFLFDIVIPFTDNSQGAMPRQVLVADQQLQLIADVDLSTAIRTYCSDKGKSDPACISIAGTPTSFPTSEPFGKNKSPRGQPFASRPQASTNGALWSDSSRVAGCLPSQGLADLATAPVPNPTLTAKLNDCFRY